MSGGSGDRYRRTVRFVLDDRVVELRDIDPTRTVLQFLRDDLRRTGTKEGCAEGDCGACTVVMAEVDPLGERLQARAVNSCIQFLPTLDGKELMTVESLSEEALHPAQQAMIDSHGSQCGFCTPGIVMSLFALYKNIDAPSRQQIDDALAGNLCRCTGYRPIVDAAVAMYELPSAADDWATLPAGSAPGEDEAARMDRLAGIRSTRTLCVGNANRKFFAPQSIDEFAELQIEYPGATILAGGTDIGLWVTKQHRDLDVIIYTGKVTEMRRAAIADGVIDIGAAVSLTDAMPLIVAEYPSLEEIFLRFASPPIRNAGTLGGNIANGSPIGDSMPALMALGTKVVLRKGADTRAMTLDAFYVAYQQTALQPGEFVERIMVPVSRAGEIVASYKVSKRFDQDISAVCSAYRLTLDDGKVGDIAIACGGMAEIPKRAVRCENALRGQPWNEATVQAGMAALDSDFTPIDDMRSTADYRRRVCRNLLKRFWLESSGREQERVYAYGR